MARVSASGALFAMSLLGVLGTRVAAASADYNPAPDPCAGGGTSGYHGPRRGALSTPQVTYAPGASVPVSAPAGAFASGTPVSLEIRWVEPVQSQAGGSGTSDGSGGFSGTATVPAGSVTGIYLIYATGLACDGSKAILEVVIVVVAPASGAGRSGGAARSAGAGAASPPAGSGGGAGGGGSGAASPAALPPEITPDALQRAQAAVAADTYVPQAARPPAVATDTRLNGSSAAHRAVSASSRVLLGVVAAFGLLLGLVALRLPRRRSS